MLCFSGRNERRLRRGVGVDFAILEGIVLAR